MFKKIIQTIKQFPYHVLLIEIFLGIFLSIGSFFLFLKFKGEVFEKEFTFFDKSIFDFLYKIRNPFLTKIMFTFSFLGNELIVFFVFILTLFFLFKKHKRESFVLFCTVLIGAILDLIFKSIIQRPRPQIASLIVEKSYSFPSGHAMDSFIFYIILAYFIYQFTRRKKLSFLILILFGTLVFLIGISRVYLGVHYASDVLAGYIAGFWWFITVVVIEKTVIVFKLFKTKNKIKL